MPAKVNVSLIDSGNGYSVTVDPWLVEVHGSAANGPTSIEWTCTYNGVPIDPVRIVFFKNHFAAGDPQGPSPISSGAVKTGNQGPKTGNTYRYRIRLFHGQGRPIVIDPEYRKVP